MGQRKGDFALSQQMDFIRDFLNYIEHVGIYDEYDKEANKMVTSPGVLSLIKQAEACLPEKLKPGQACARMRDLSPDLRDKLIAEAEQDKVIDMRREFQLKMSKNGGALGIVEQLVAAYEGSRSEDFSRVIENARALVHGPENVIQPENDNQ
jgi:hypothetical protein